RVKVAAACHQRGGAIGVTAFRRDAQLPREEGEGRENERGRGDHSDRCRGRWPAGRAVGEGGREREWRGRGRAMPVVKPGAELRGKLKDDNTEDGEGDRASDQRRERAWAGRVPVRATGHEPTSGARSPRRLRWCQSLLVSLNASSVGVSVTRNGI